MNDERDRAAGKTIEPPGQPFPWDDLDKLGD